MHGAIQEQAGESLAADLVLSSGVPLPARFIQKAKHAGARTAEAMDFPTVIFSGNHSVLADIHAVGRNYPLRGKVRISPQPFALTHVAHPPPAIGTVWVTPRILAALGLQIGDTIQIGKLTARITAVIAYLPDGGFGFLSIAPKILLNYRDIPLTTLVNSNSRVAYKLLMSGTPGVIGNLRAAFRNHLPAGVEMRDANDSEHQLAAATGRAQRFLALAALVSVLVSAVAIVLAARRYTDRYTDTIAVLRCLGLKRWRVQLLLLLELLWLGIAASAIGVVIGFFAQFGLVAMLKGLLPALLPAASFTPALSASGICLVMLMGFALPPLMRVANTPPARVLRHDLLPPPVRGYLIYGAAVLATLAITWWQVGELRLAWYVLLGLVITVTVLALGAAVLLLLLRPLRHGAGIGWHYGLANLNRHRRDVIIQLVAFGVGFMVLLLLGLVRDDLLSAWRTTLPKDAPNQFIINIQPNARAQVEKFFVANRIAAPMLYPMVRARLTAIDGIAVTKIHFASARAQHLLDREANLSWAGALPPANTIVAGRWWNKHEADEPLASVETKFAKQLNLKIGDRLTFDLMGTPVTVTVASLREVHWESFQPNFFVELSPGALADYPATWITSVYVPPEKSAMLGNLVRKLPSLTIFDVDAIMQQIRHLMAQASLAVEYVFLFTLGSGIVVLLAAVQATREERRFEAAVLRTLGASRRLVRSAAVAEFATLGFSAGLLGALAATLIAWVLANRVFLLPYHPDWRVWVIGLVSGTLIVAASGMLATWRLLRVSPMEVLRET